MDPIQQAVEDSQYAHLPPEEREAYKAECDAVKKLWDEYTKAREFDKAARAQYAIDRRYAGGDADPTWAVDTNLIGSFIDILTSFLYARNPDVSVRKSPRVDSRGTRQQDDFAKTMELVISRLWKQGRLKPQARKTVRSSLSVGPGWLKAVMIADSPDMPQMQMELNDIRDNLAALQLQAEKVGQGQTDGIDTEQLNADLQKYNELQASVTDRMEASIRKYMAFDFVAAEDMQVSLDVANLEDHLDAGWNSNAIYRLKSELKAMFPKLTKEEIAGATSYYQRQQDPSKLATLTDRVGLPGHGNALNAEDADRYSKGGSTATNLGDQGPEFAKIVELWDKNTGHVRTMIDGVKTWAKAPYQPPYPSTRFYPYFNLSFFLTDGARHPQSLSWRLRKLQDEYARSRSNFRITRERAIPGVIFNKTGISPEDAKAITESVHQEYVGIEPTEANTPITNLFAPKPYAPIDMRLFDNAPIIADMEKVSGVQEALQSSTSVQKTATQADIEQQGFASRTTADRDTLESMLNDLATYTGEVALSALTTKDAQRIAGAAAFWPEGMDIDDLLTMVEIEITAGTTGKPKSMGDREAWGVILPTLKETLMEIQQALAMGNIPLAKSLSELVRETMARMGDDSDVERFIPAIPEVDPLTGQPIGVVPPVVPPVGAGPSGLPPSGPPADGGAPPLENPPLVPPELPITL